MPWLGYHFQEPCTCRRRCGDTDDEIGTCKDLPRAPEPPLVEIVMVRRDDPSYFPTEGTEDA